MKKIKLLLIGAVCLTVAPAIHGDSNLGPQTQTPRFNVDVTVTGRIKGVGGTFGDLFLGFSGPVRVPNATLAAGTYIFTEIPRYSQNFVRVTSEDRRTVFAAFPVILAKRTGPIDYAQVNFHHDGTSEPMRIREVYGQGTALGYAPVYSH